MTSIKQDLQVFKEVFVTKTNTVLRKWEQAADTFSLQKVATSLKKNGFEVKKVANEKAKEEVFKLIPEGSEVMNMTSRSLDELGISKEIIKSGKYNAVKNQLAKMDRATQSREMQKLGTAPEFAVGSVHALTEDGKIVVASNSGSQLPAYVYGARKVVFVVGAQKIVRDLEEGLKRIEEYVLPLESERVQEAYGLERSFINKLLILNREPIENRTTVLILIQEIGF